MTEHTTIQITKAQAEELAELRNYDDEPYKSVIGRLLNDNSAIDSQEIMAKLEESESDVTIDVEDARLLAQHVEKRLAGHFSDLENELPRKVSAELQR